MSGPGSSPPRPAYNNATGQRRGDGPAVRPPAAAGAPPRGPPAPPGQVEQVIMATSDPNARDGTDRPNSNFLELLRSGRVNDAFGVARQEHDDAEPPPSCPNPI